MKDQILLLNDNLTSNKEKLQQVAAEIGADYRDIKLQKAGLHKAPDRSLYKFDS